MDFAEELRGSLPEFLVGASIEIRENGSRSTTISPLSWEVRGEGGKPLLHPAENCNVTRRVLAIADHSDSRMALEVKRFGRVDVLLLTEQVYKQVFAQTAAQHGILDLFGITRAGRHSGIEDRRRSGPGILAPGNGTKSPASAWQNAGVAASA